MSCPMDVLVTGADRRQGLAVIRALGSRGLSVLAAGPDRRSLGFFSRYTRASCWYPDPLANKHDFVEMIRTAVERHHVSFVFPVAEETVIVLDEFRAEFAGPVSYTHLTLPTKA